MIGTVVDGDDGLVGVGDLPPHAVLSPATVTTSSAAMCRSSLMTDSMPASRYSTDAKGPFVTRITALAPALQPLGQ